VILKDSVLKDSAPPTNSKAVSQNYTRTDLDFKFDGTIKNLILGFRFKHIHSRTFSARFKSGHEESLIRSTTIMK
jgi:hypothetical protein